MTAAIGSVVLSLAINILWPDVPFMNRVGVVFLITLAAAVAVSLIRPAKVAVSTVTLQGISFKTSTVFNLAGVGVIGILIALYSIWW